MGLSRDATGAPRSVGRIVAVGLTGALLGTVLTLALAGTSDDGVSAPPTPAVQPAALSAAAEQAPDTAMPTEEVTVSSVATVAETPPATEPLGQVPPPAPPAGLVSADEAGRIAAAHVGGVVDTIHAEDGDHGAAWDVDVYAPDGEYTIYISATGEVVHVEGPYRD
jgi:glucose/arabinose dehydrogenase